MENNYVIFFSIEPNMTLKNVQAGNRELSLLSEAKLEF